MTSDHPLQRYVEMYRSPGDFFPTSNTIKVMALEVSKGLKSLTLALHVPAPGEEEKETARVLYVPDTRATQRLLIESDEQIENMNSKSLALTHHY